MATITWPSTLPQTFQRDSYQEELSNNVIRDPFEVGPSGLRRRVTANITLATGMMFLTTEQWEDLALFIANETLERSLAFGFPAQGVPVVSPVEEWLVLMDKPPTRTWLAEDFWLVTISFVILPQ